MKKYICIGSIIIVSIANVLTYHYSSSNVANNIAQIIGSFMFPLIVGFLFAKFTNKKADKATKFVTFTFAYSIVLILSVIYNL